MTQPELQARKLNLRQEGCLKKHEDYSIAANGNSVSFL